MIPGEPLGSGGGGLGAGGAIFVHQGSVTLVNSTLTINTVQGGGGKSARKSHGGRALGAAIFNLNGTVSIYNSTVAANLARVGTNIVADNPAEMAQGGAVYLLALGQGAPAAVLHLGNSILAGSLTSGGGNLDLVSDNQQGKTTITIDSSGPSLVTACNFCDDPARVGSLQLVVKQDPMLSPLSDNGGAAETLAPSPASQAIGRGEPSLCAGALVQGLDQRGVARPSRCTLGAYEPSSPDDQTGSGCRLIPGAATRPLRPGPLLGLLVLLGARRPRRRRGLAGS